MRTSLKRKSRSWLLDCLLDDELISRTKGIEELTSKALWAPTTEFFWIDNRLEQTQQFIHQGSSRPKKHHVEVLAQYLDQELQMVHGDLCFKNLVFDGHQLWVVDWEPSLLQFRDGATRFLVTEPYWALDDRIHKRISKKTDKLTFFFTAFQIIHQRNPLVYLREWITVRQARSVPMTPIPEETLCTLSFSEIVALVNQYGNWTPRLVFGEEK
jgi:hypothetical protein